MERYVQIEGNGKGNEVEVLQERNGLLTVRSIETDFIYYISLKDFQQHYEAKK